MRIEIISGSPRPNSVTHRVALHLQIQLLKNKEHEVGYIIINVIKKELINSKRINRPKFPALGGDRGFH